jgi:mono/diheme cytochrome c family protein
MRIRSTVLPVAVAVAFTALAGSAAAQTPPVIFVGQGANWTAATRASFYSQDQGSRMIPYDWLAALKQPNGQAFLADNLARYGYLTNPANTNGLPVGFTVSGPAGAQVAGMSCAACHTRQITVSGVPYRIDGGPAIADFQHYLADLDAAVGSVLASDAAFATFASAVLQSPSPPPNEVLALRAAVDGWYLRYHTLISRALPKTPWGPSRLDAVGMIFNRLTGLDLGPAPSYLIADNIKVADAPVRYPFLWNAARQDFTQWPGFAQNGDDLLGLARNLGEVYGVFGVFQPIQNAIYTDYLHNNSANFDGLGKLEDLIKLIGPPQWPWQVDANLAAQGEAIYNRQGSCGDCHGIKPGQFRSIFQETWATPVQNVGTDTREYDIMAWMAKTGALEGSYPLGSTEPLKANEPAFTILTASVLGSIAQHYLIGSGVFAAVPPPGPAANTQVPSQLRGRLPPQLRGLEGAFRPPAGVSRDATMSAAAQAPPHGAYESRVMQGIWAAAPYLHNGSVPTLAELLKKPADRVKKFKVGPAYDIVNVGLAADQTRFDYELQTGCGDINSGNSNCGHDFGTNLSDQEKKALLEYLKTL